MLRSRFVGTRRDLAHWIRRQPLTALILGGIPWTAAFVGVLLTVSPWERAVLIMLTPTVVGALLLAWAFYEESMQSAERVEWLETNGVADIVAVLKRLHYAASCAGVCARPAFRRENELPHRSTLAESTGFVEYEDVISQVLEASLPVANRRFAIYYWSDPPGTPNHLASSLHPLVTRGYWKKPPPVFGVRDVLDTNQINASGSFLKDVRAPSNRVVTNVLEPRVDEDRPVSDCARDHLDGPSYRSLGWYPCSIYPSSHHANMNTSALVVGAILVQVEMPSAIKPDLHSTLNVVALMLAQGYVSAAANLNGSHNAVE